MSIISFYGEFMKGWNITNPLNIEEKDITESSLQENHVKVRLTKSMITLSDVLRYAGEIECNDVLLGSYGIGIVSETNINLFGLEKGNRVYIEPTRMCNECYNCKNSQSSKCLMIKSAGEDFDGFLSDFTSAPPENLFILPENVTDLEALFIEHISLAMSVIDRLDIQKGDYVSIVGTKNFGIILAQLLIYYQAVPIIMTLDEEEDYKIAKDSGIYYVLGPKDNWAKEVSSITSGRMTDKVVYVSDCDIPTIKAFSVASHSANIAYTGVSYQNNTISFMQAVKKQLDVKFINNGFGYTASSINILANKAINISNLKLNKITYEQVPETLKALNDDLLNERKIYETVVEMI